MANEKQMKKEQDTALWQESTGRVFSRDLPRAKRVRSFYFNLGSHRKRANSVHSSPSKSSSGSQRSELHRPIYIHMHLSGEISGRDA